MRQVVHDEADEVQKENDVVSLCSLYAGSETFGIDTSKIREVLGSGICSRCRCPRHLSPVSSRIGGRC